MAAAARLPPPADRTMLHTNSVRKEFAQRKAAAAVGAERSFGAFLQIDTGDAGGLGGSFLADLAVKIHRAARSEYGTIGFNTRTKVGRDAFVDDEMASAMRSTAKAMPWPDPRLADRGILAVMFAGTRANLSAEGGRLFLCEVLPAFFVTRGGARLPIHDGLLVGIGDTRQSVRKAMVIGHGLLVEDALAAEWPLDALRRQGGGDDGFADRVAAERKRRHEDDWQRAWLAAKRFARAWIDRHQDEPAGRMAAMFAEIERCQAIAAAMKSQFGFEMASGRVMTGDQAQVLGLAEAAVTRWRRTKNDLIRLCQDLARQNPQLYLSLRGQG
ncbi:MAG: hypothetical protein GC191_16445 [Azospirillum sp.]|nr:hypothetical protein [Azospirillum sp.]